MDRNRGNRQEVVSFIHINCLALSMKIDCLHQTSQIVCHIIFMNSCENQSNWHKLQVAPNAIDPPLIAYTGFGALQPWSIVQYTENYNVFTPPEDVDIRNEEPMKMDERAEETISFPTIQKMEENDIQALQQYDQIKMAVEDNIKVQAYEAKVEEFTIAEDESQEEDEEDQEDYQIGRNDKKRAKKTTGEKNNTGEKKKGKRPSSLATKSFQEIVGSSAKVPPLELAIKGYKEQLEVELQKEATESGNEAKYISREMDIARKHITQKYLRLFRLVLPFIRQRKDKQQKLAKLKNTMSHSTSSIPTVMEIYREPDFSFFVDFLRQQIVTEERLPKFIMALPMKAAEKIVMLGGVEGMVFAINNPHVTLRSWHFDPSDLLGDTTHIVQAIKEKKADSEEVVQMLTKVYEKVQPIEGSSKNQSKYKHVSCRYAIIIRQAFVEANAYGLISKQDEIELKVLTKRISKTAKIGTVKQLLGYGALREYVKAKFIDNNRILIQMLSDSTLNCRTKLGLIESYKAFMRATVDPQSLKRWQ